MLRLGDFLDTVQDALQNKVDGCVMFRTGFWVVMDV